MEDDVHLGEPESVLALARQHGLTVRQKLIVSPNSMKPSRSLRLMSTLHELTRLKEALDQVEYKMTCLLLDKDSLDLLHTDNLDHKQRQLDSLTSYFARLVQNTERIVTQLQKVTLDSSLKVEAQYHRHIYKSLSLLTQILNKLPEHCQRINSLKQYQLKSDPNKVKLLSSSVQLLIDCKIDTQRLQNHISCRPMNINK